MTQFGMSIQQLIDILLLSSKAIHTSELETLKQIKSYTNHNKTIQRNYTMQCMPTRLWCVLKHTPHLGLDRALDSKNSILVCTKYTPHLGLDQVLDSQLNTTQQTKIFTQVRCIFLFFSFKLDYFVSSHKLQVITHQTKQHICKETHFNVRQVFTHIHKYAHMS